MYLDLYLPISVIKSHSFHYIIIHHQLVIKIIIFLDVDIDILFSSLLQYLLPSPNKEPKLIAFASGGSVRFFPADQVREGIVYKKHRSFTGLSCSFHQDRNTNRWAWRMSTSSDPSGGEDRLEVPFEEVAEKLKTVVQEAEWEYMKEGEGEGTGTKGKAIIIEYKPRVSSVLAFLADTLK